MQVQIVQYVHAISVIIRAADTRARQRAHRVRAAAVSRCVRERWWFHVDMHDYVKYDACVSIFGASFVWWNQDDIMWTKIHVVHVRMHHHQSTEWSSMRVMFVIVTIVWVQLYV